MAISKNRGFVDLQEIAGLSRIQGLWKLLGGYRAVYLLAALSLGMSALLRAGTYFLIRYFVKFGEKLFFTIVAPVRGII